MALSPNREEYARPLSTQEYYRLAERVRDSKYRTPGGLIGADISGMMMYIGISEEEARAMIVTGFAEPVAKELPLEYAVEMNNLIKLEMEGAIG